MNVVHMIVLAAGLVAAAGPVTLEECRRKAREHHPWARQKDLIARTEGFSVANANRGYLPQLSITGKSTDQSDPAMRGLETDQTQVVAEIGQTLWDGGAASARKRVAKATATADAAKLESDLHTLRSRVDQFFFGILSIDERIVQNDILERDLRTNLERVKAYRDNGIANQSDVDALQVEILRTRQRRTELVSSGDAYRSMLSLLMGEPVDSSRRFERPALQAPAAAPVNRRPELAMLQAQEELAQSQDASLFARNAPRLGAFLQLGWGKPGLSLANTEFTSFWVAGLRLSWDIGGLWTLGNDRALIALQREAVRVRKDAFELDVGLETARGTRDIDKYRSLIAQDDEIVALRTRIRSAAEAKVAAGAMSVADLVREMDAEAAARQDRILHEMLLLQAIANLETTTNDGKSP